MLLGYTAADQKLIEAQTKPFAACKLIERQMRPVAAKILTVLTGAHMQPLADERLSLNRIHLLFLVSRASWFVDAREAVARDLLCRRIFVLKELSLNRIHLFFLVSRASWFVDVREAVARELLCRRIFVLKEFHNW